MGTEIKTWQIIDNKLAPINTTMPEGDRLERDLELWITSNPEIIGTDVMNYRPTGGNRIWPHRSLGH
jgi:hypothetical protein